MPFLLRKIKEFSTKKSKKYSWLILDTFLTNIRQNLSQKGHQTDNKQKRPKFLLEMAIFLQSIFHIFLIKKFKCQKLRVNEQEHTNYKKSFSRTFSMGFTAFHASRVSKFVFPAAALFPGRSALVLRVYWVQKKFVFFGPTQN